MTESFRAKVNCSICNKPVCLEISKTDAHGKAVHLGVLRIYGSVGKGYTTPTSTACFLSCLPYTFGPHPAISALFKTLPLHW